MNQQDDLYSPDEIIAIVARQATSMAELRLVLEYGTYSSNPLALSNLRTRLLSSTPWAHAAWAELAPLVQAERRRLNDYEQRWPRLSVPSTPYLSAIRTAVKNVGSSLTAKEVEREIQAYAERCKNGPNGVKTLVETCQFWELACRINDDGKLLKRLFGGRARDRKDVAECLKRCKRLFFEWTVEDSETGHVHI